MFMLVLQEMVRGLCVSPISTIKPRTIYSLVMFKHNGKNGYYSF